MVVLGLSWPQNPNPLLKGFDSRMCGSLRDLAKLQASKMSKLMNSTTTRTPGNPVMTEAIEAPSTPDLESVVGKLVAAKTISIPSSNKHDPQAMDA